MPLKRPRWGIRIGQGDKEAARPVARPGPPGEGEFGLLKHHYGLDMLRVRGIEPVRLHVDLVILGSLATALRAAREAGLIA